MGGDIEGGVGDITIRDDADAPDMGDFFGFALLDGDFNAGFQGGVDGGGGGGHIKWDTVLFGQHGHGVGADFVSRIAISGDSVSADDDAVNLALIHKVAGHRIGNQGDRDARFLKLPDGQAGALEEGAGLIGKHLYIFALLMRPDNHPQGGAVACGG